MTDSEKNIETKPKAKTKTKAKAKAKAKPKAKSKIKPKAETKKAASTANVAPFMKKDNTAKSSSAETSESKSSTSLILPGVFVFVVIITAYKFAARCLIMSFHFSLIKESDPLIPDNMIPL